MTETTLDNILSGGSDAAPAGEVEKEVTQDVGAAEGQTDEQPEANQDEPESGGQRMVPQAALHAEKQKSAKRYTEVVESFEKKLTDQNAAWDRRFQQLVATLNQPKQEPQQAPDIFENPDAAIDHRLGNRLDPFDQRVSSLETRLIRLAAVSEHGAEKVKAFEDYVQQAMERGDPEMQILGAQMRASLDPMATGLKWFEQRTFDPAAERERLKAEILAELQNNGGQQQQAKPAPLLPSNLAGARNVGSRAGPAWSGPQTLTDIFKR